MNMNSYAVQTVAGRSVKVDAEMVVNFDDRIELRANGESVACFMKHSLMSFELRTKASTEPEA